MEDGNNGQKSWICPDRLFNGFVASESRTPLLWRNRAYSNTSMLGQCRDCWLLTCNIEIHQVTYDWGRADLAFEPALVRLLKWETWSEISVIQFKWDLQGYLYWQYLQHVVLGLHLVDCTEPLVVSVRVSAKRIMEKLLITIFAGAIQAILLLFPRDGRCFGLRK